LLCSGAIVANLLAIRSGRLQRPAVFVWWNRAAWVMALCWVLPLAEELLDSPGNLTLIARFFGNGQHPQPFIDGFKIWAVMISGVLLPRLVPPTGNPIAPDPSAVAVILAVSQMLGLLVAVAAALGKRRRFDALFGAAGLLSAVVALWSVSNVPVIIGDYHVFWISIIGALNWECWGGGLRACCRPTRCPNSAASRNACLSGVHARAPASTVAHAARQGAGIGPGQ
jgi:hypothetical protein